MGAFHAILIVNRQVDSGADIAGIIVGPEMRRAVMVTGDIREIERVIIRPISAVDAVAGEVNTWRVVGIAFQYHSGKIRRVAGIRVNYDAAGPGGGGRGGLVDLPIAKGQTGGLRDKVPVANAIVVEPGGVAGRSWLNLGDPDVTVDVIRAVEGLGNGEPVVVTERDGFPRFDEVSVRVNLRQHGAHGTFWRFKDYDPGLAGRQVALGKGIINPEAISRHDKGVGEARCAGDP